VRDPGPPAETIDVRNSSEEIARGPAVWLGALLLLLLAAMPLGAAHAEVLAPNQGAVIRQLMPSVVNISSQKAVREPGSGIIASSPHSRSAHIVAQSGSGFVIDPSGVVATNWHVVEASFEITITFEDGSRVPATVMAAARTMDIALLKVDPPHPLTPVRFGDSDKLQIGDPVLVIGNPLGIGMSVTAGIVSALNRDIADTPYDHFIQTDAAINHGNSGGPMFNSEGELVGLNTALYSPTSGSVGLGFAIPSNDVRFVVDRLLKFGSMRPGWIGVKIQQVTPEMANAIGMAKPQGSLVTAVLADGPAWKGGIRVGDIITQFDDNSPGDERALLRDIVETAAGHDVPITVVRHGQPVPLHVTVAEWPRTQGEDPNEPLMAERPHLATPPDLGLSLGTLTNDMRARYGIGGDQPGVLITAVAPNTDAADRGLSSGDVILRMFDATVGSPAEVKQRLEEARALKRDFALLLIQPKTLSPAVPRWAAAKWVALRIASD
jgi:serine protease Do